MRSSRLLLPWKIATGCEPSSAKGSMRDRCRMVRKLSLAAERRIEVVVAYLLYGIILARRNMIDRIWIVPGSSWWRPKVLKAVKHFARQRLGLQWACQNMRGHLALSRQHTLGGCHWLDRIVRPTG
ncbi:unnamed protein product [Victoria cruziana]